MDTTAQNKPAPKNRQGRPKTFNKQAVLETATRTYWGTDPTSVSVNKICKNASVSKPSLYREFGNEDGLTRSSIEHFMSTYGMKVTDILTDAVTFETKVNRLIDLISIDREFACGSLYIKMRASKHCFGPQTQEKLTELESVLRKEFITCVRQSLASTDWSQEKVSLAALYISEQIGLGFTQRAMGESPTKIRAMLKMSLSVFQKPIIPFG